jgi:hypothetical protein
MADLIERLRASDTLSRGENYEPWVIPASELRLEAAAEIASLRTALATAEKELAGAKAMSDAHREHAQTAVEQCASLNRLLSIAEANTSTAESSLAEAKRLLKPFREMLKTEFSASVSDDRRITIGVSGAAMSLVTKMTAGDFRAAARFLAQEPNHER